MRNTSSYKSAAVRINCSGVSKDTHGLSVLPVLPICTFTVTVQTAAIAIVFLGLFPSSRTFLPCFSVNERRYWDDF